MNKRFVILLVLGLLILGITQLAYATEVVVNEDSERSCFLDYLSPEAKVQAENIIKEFHAAMTALRARMAEVRGTGNTEARDEVRAEMRVAQEAKRAAIADLLPEGVKEQYLERGVQEGQGQRMHAPADSQVGFGGKGNGQQMRSASDNI